MRYLLDKIFDEKKITFPFLLLLFLSASSQDRYTISGYITDKNNGESVVGANIYCKELQLGVTSNTYGFYSLTLPEGVYSISYTFIGYRAEDKSFQLTKSINYDVEFELSSVNIQEVVVRADKSIVKKHRLQ